jgi:protein-S-isoprenylcysteine O-methyltransferase Ste14
MRHVVYDLSVVTWTCWGAVGLIWAVGAVIAGHGRSSVVRDRSGRDVASTVGVVLGLAVVLAPESMWRSISVHSSWLRIVGMALLVAATAATIWARLALGTMWSSAAVAKAGHRLRTEGPYRITRHPIYSGILVMLAATALAQGLGRWVALLVAVALVLVAKLREEERLLMRAFPNEYPRYQQRVPALVPRLVPRGR